MIISIDNLHIRETLSGNAEKFNSDLQRRTVSGRLITKLSPSEKWRITLNYEGRTLPADYMRAIYLKCQEMRKTSKVVTFISPYDGIEYSVKMKCTEPFPPKLLHIEKGSPKFYQNIGAVFEEE